MERRMTGTWFLNRLLHMMIGVCLLGWVAGADCAEPVRKKVLVLNSYHSGYKGSDDAVAGIKETLLRALPETEIQVEYLDSKNNSGKEFDAKVVDLLRFKYQQRHFDLILSTDDYAFNVIEAHRPQLFGATPVVFCGTNSFDGSRLAGKRGIVGIDERPSFKATLDLIFALHPATRNIVVIRDDSVTGQLNEMEFRKAAAQLQDKATFSDWAGLRLDQFISRTRELKPGSVIVYFASFVQDGNGDRVSSNEALRRISSASPVPVYGGWEFNLGKGIVGGRLLNLREHGAAAAALAVRVLRGESVDALPPVTPSPNKDMFDYNELRRFGIAQGKLPADSIIINRPPGYVYSHRVEMLSTISVLLLFALATSFVKLVNSRKHLQVHRDALVQRNEELEQALSKVKVLEGIIPVCMYCKKVRKDERSWQQMESYISQHTEAQFSHGICPTCFDDNFSGKKPKQL
ncbi:hypothetical protein M1B72_06705 [Geomonas paludis]|uniref:ABC transporter substrate-binding protein n=1 Tax=Geomonas paludis TaxID=2740185 RepID=A0ABY4LK54_9BACT|nr:hypothetical protein [Geomonas paludis]UPU37390.1 hypothetical protein M1B72_06705 [Geomonas paludis]